MGERPQNKQEERVRSPNLSKAWSLLAAKVCSVEKAGRGTSYESSLPDGVVGRHGPCRPTGPGFRSGLCH